MQELLADSLDLLGGHRPDARDPSAHFHHAQVFRVEVIKKLRAVCGEDHLAAPRLRARLELLGQDRKGAGVDALLRLLEKQRLLGWRLVQGNQVSEKAT